MIRGEGPTPNAIFVLGEHPTRDDAKTGRPYSGRIAKDLFYRYFNGMTLPGRDDLYLTYLIKEWNSAGEYGAADYARDEPLVRAELAKVNPKLVIALGREPSRFFLGDVDMDEVQGLPWLCRGFDEIDNGGDFVVFPIYSPAAGMFSPEMQSQIAYGFTQLEAYFKSVLPARTLYDDPIPTPAYHEITDAETLESVCHSFNGSVRLGVDTEGYPHRPWSLQFAATPGVAYLLRSDRTSLVAHFGRVLRERRPRLIFHNALHELAIFRALGIKIDDLPFDDTMVMAYLLQLEPQGLKPLCVRHCNMKMSSYMEVLGDVGNQLAIEYLLSLHDLEEHDWKERNESAFIKLLEAGRRVTKIKEGPKSPLHKSVVRCLRSDRPRGLWEDQVEDVHVAGYTRLGEMDEPTLDYVDPGVAIPYGCRDADGTLRLEPHLQTRIDALGLRNVYELEIGTYPLIDRMHATGLLPDLQHFATLSTKLGGEIADIRQRLVALTGLPEFNANSGDQVAAHLFDTLGLPPVKFTKGKDGKAGRGGTNDKILEALEHEHGAKYPVVSTIREYREVYKLKHTFVDRIPDFVHRWPHDARVHSTFRTTRVVTGRLAASDPNVLAMPKHGKFAKDFRRGWIAAPGHVLGSWDLSQIELRVLADLSQDPVLLNAFRTGVDLHATLAQRIFGVEPKHQDKSKHRLPAKAVNFGIPMGMQAQGLSLELRKNGLEIDEDDAQRWLNDTMALYKEVPRYQQSKIAEARRYGYVRCLSGRIRYIGGIRSFDRRIQAESERFAFSTPIQEGAQTVMKTAEWHLWQYLNQLWSEGRWIEPLVQIHDDLTLELESPRMATDINEHMIWIMTKTYDGLSVPIETSGDVGFNLRDQHTIGCNIEGGSCPATCTCECHTRKSK